MGIKRFIKSKHLPWVFGVVAIVMMLPALKTGLVMDDLVQRIPQLKPSQIPPALYHTGTVPDNTGQLSTVLFETFGFPRDKTRGKMIRNYGILPWWLSNEAKLALWRPFTAFTQWLDYRAFPDSPALMHAHNIAWFAVVVFLVTILYRKIIGPTAIAGLAGLMFILDKNTYFPVMFVANRGFIVALCFGLICFYMHHKWRSTNSTSAGILSVVFFSLSLLSNEAGVSTFAFVLAYAIVLEKASWKKRLSSLLPAIVTIIVWRIIYQSLGYGVSGIGEGYLDPGHEPLKFLYHLPGYGMAVIAGQLSALPPEIMLAVNLHYFGIISMFYIGFTVVAIVLFLPIIRKDTLARFWFAVMIFAAVPVASAPMSKNFGFVAVGAFGFIAVFAGDLIKNQSWLAVSRFYKRFALTFCIILLAVHIPLAAVSRLTVLKTAPFMLGALAFPAGLSNTPLSNDSNVVIVNAPCQLNVCVIPFNVAYYGRPIPKSIRALAFAYTGLEIERINNKSLVIRSQEENIFTSDQTSPLHLAHAFAIMDRLLHSSRMFEKNRRFVLEGMTVGVLGLDNNNLPKELAFTFDAPLEHERFRWLQFNWYSLEYEPFNLPKVGQTVATDDPPVVRFSDAMRFLLGE
jgi:hypothetical protein